MKNFNQARKEFKQRNIVHLNAPKSGAGKHTDRKKQMKQGVVKHKGKMYESLREDMHDKINPYMLWKNKEPVKYSMHLSNTFGPPAELTPFRAVWYAKDGFKRIVVKDEYILHGSPAPHYDFIYCYIDLKVPHDIADELADSSESILIDFLKNEVGARCGSITANAVTLNYVLDVVAGRVKPTKQEYEKRILQMKDMFKSGKVYTTPCYMLDANIGQIYQGATNVVKAMLKA